METLLDTIVNGFLTAIQGGTMAVAPYGVALLGAMALLAYWFRFAPEVASAGVGLGDALAAFLFLVIGLGITQWIVLNLIPMGDALYQSAIQIGLSAAGSNISSEQLRNPSFILSMHKVVTRPLEDFILNQTGWAQLWNSSTIWGYWSAEMVIYVVFVGIALNMAMIVLEFYFSILAAAVLLPCVVFFPSAALGEFAVGWVLGGTVRLFLVTAVAGIAVPLFETLAAPSQGIATDPRWVEVIGLVAAALLFGIIAWVVPSRAANLVGQGLGISASTVMGAAASSTRGVIMLQSAIRGTSNLLQRG